MMKRLSAILIALILAAAIAILPAAATKDKIRVVDKADILTDQQEAALQEKLNEYSESNDCDFVVLTEPDLKQESFPFNGTVGDFADEYYDRSGYDQDGVLILIVFDDGYGKRQVYISTSGKCIDRLSDEEREEIIDDAYADLKAGNYSSALNTIADGLNDKLPIRLKWYMLPLAILIGFFLAMVVMLMIRGKLKTVAMQSGAANYVRAGSMHVTTSRDTYLYSTVSKTARQTSSSSGGSSHTSSGGGTHGGGGRSF